MLHYGIKQKKIINSIILFFSFSIFGWIAETFAFIFAYGLWRDRGFLIFPMCPIYGFAVSVSYLILDSPFSGKWQVLTNKLGWGVTFVFYYLVTTIILNAFELFGGIFFDKIFNLRLWDYRGCPYNLNGYIYLQGFFLWGAAAMPALMIANWYIKKIINAYSYKIVINVLIVLIIVVSADFLFNILYLIITGNHFILFASFYS